MKNLYTLCNKDVKFFTGSQSDHNQTKSEKTKTFSKLNFFCKKLLHL